MRKVAVVGSVRSTFAVEHGRHTDVPVTHLDRAYRRPNYRDPAR